MRILGILTGIAVLTLLCSTPVEADVSINILGFRYESVSSKSPSLELTIEQRAPELTGKWSAQFTGLRPSTNQQVWFTISIRDGNSQHAFTSYADQANHSYLFAPKKAWDGQHQTITPAGILSLSGQFSKKSGSGTFVFTPDGTYLAQAASQLANEPSTLELLELGLSGATIEDMIAFKNSGLKITAAEMIRLKRARVTSQYAVEVRKARLFSCDEIVRLRQAGVAETFPATVKNAGYDLTAEELVRLRHSGLSAEDVVGWKNAGFNWQADNLVKLRNAGVKPDFGQAVKELFPQISSADMVKLRHSGLTKEYLAAMNKVEPQFSVEEIIKLRHNGVTAEYIAGWQKAGFKLSADELIKLRNNGVPVDYAAALNVPNRKPVPVDTMIQLRHRGMNAEELRALRE